MIYGKPITFGSGGLMAEILCSGDVTSTDTITCTNGIKSYSAIWVTDHFVISGLDLGTYTVTATQSGKEFTTNVLIDEIAQYDVDVEYRYYLYNLGDEYEDRTGGWSDSGVSVGDWSGTKVSPTKQSDKINVNLSVGNQYSLPTTVNQISITNQKIKCKVRVNSFAFNTYDPTIQIFGTTSKAITGSTLFVNKSLSVTSVGEFTIESDSVVTTSGYVSIGFNCAFRTGRLLNADLLAVWLE